MSFIFETAKSIKADVIKPLEYTVINFGGKAVYVEGFIRVINVSSERVDFLCKKCVISVIGKDLVIAEIDGQTAVVKGYVEGVNRE